jgi:hypothetical protein
LSDNILCANERRVMDKLMRVVITLPEGLKTRGWKMLARKRIRELLNGPGFKSEIRFSNAIG